ncbi:MAG: hypothetical protein P8P56_05815 [Yoonia sp.]|nr:hypothetical protein [Yoonia sp.]
MSQSGNAAMANATGRATFSGAGALIVNPTIINGQIAFAEAILLGDADVAVNFKTDTLSGIVTNMYGIDGNENVDTYSGTITISNGIIGAGGANNIDADFSGTVRGNNDVISVRGEMEGDFYGNPSVRALDLGGVGTSTIRGFSGTSIFGVTAERD